MHLNECCILQSVTHKKQRHLPTFANISCFKDDLCAILDSSEFEKNLPEKRIYWLELVLKKKIHRIRKLDVLI